MAKLTVAVPVYNAMPHLPECVESILGQSFTDFELLIVNDGSSDGSLEFLKSIRDPRLRLISQSNQGLTATLNRMLREAKTDWLVRQDADDVSYRDRLKNAFTQLERYPDAGMFYSFADYYPRSSVGMFRSTSGTPEELRRVSQSGYLLSICHTSAILSVPKTLSLGGYRFDLHVEDKDLWWRMALAHDIRLIPETTVGFRQNPNSVSSINLQQQAVNALYVQYLLISYLWGLEPFSIDEVRRTLKGMVSARKLRSKTHLRHCNIELGRSNRFAALVHAVSAFSISPANVMTRLAEEFFPNNLLTEGEPPAKFRKFQGSLWGTAFARA